VHMNGRVQDPVLGRFLSADPLIPQPLSTQSYNRYSYVSNRPLTWIDPDGFQEVPVGVLVTGERLPCLECPASMDSMSARSLLQSFINQFIFQGRHGIGGITAESVRERHSDPDRGKNFGNGDSEGSWSGTDKKAVGMTAVHLALGAASLSEIPLISQGAGLADAVISLVEGDWKGAGLSTAGILPGVGAVADTANLARRGGKLVGAARAATAGSKVALPTLKSSRFGSKIADDLPDGVPRNWSKAEIEDAIVDFNVSLASRRRELAAFDAVGGGSPGLRLGHAQRITQEETFLKSLEKALGR
jgi:hypothetical protein